MTILTQRMREELVRRNYAETTIRTYLRSVEQFREYARKRLDHLGPDDLRRYQAHLLENKKLAVGTVVLHVSALRFLYVKVLGRREMKRELPYPKERKRLPIILSPATLRRHSSARRRPAEYSVISIARWDRVRAESIKSATSPALNRVFRGKFVDGLRRAYKHDKLQLGGSLETLKELKNFGAFLRILFRKKWVVYAKPAFGGPSQALRYLGRYTHRVAISNHRLLAFGGERVTFRWKDYANGNRQRTMTLSAAEFLRRFVQQVLPRGFVRIRQFGLLANRCRKGLPALARRLLISAPQPSRLSQR